ncbi:13218_t:CDS:2, partial [Funneliformis geosporum]
NNNNDSDDISLPPTKKRSVTKSLNSEPQLEEVSKKNISNEEEQEGSVDLISDDDEDLLEAAKLGKYLTEENPLQKLKADMDDENMKELHGGEIEINIKQLGSKSSSIYKAPTNEEIQGLKEISGLFKSNIFKLQIDELLSEVNLDYNATTRLENALHKLKQILENIKDKPELTITETTANMLKDHKVVIPFPDPQPTDDIKIRFGFKKPSAFYIVGSYPLKTVALGRNGFNVDVAVILPQRSYYLAVLAASLQENKLGLNVNVEFGTLDGDNRRPILILKPSKDHLDTDFSKLNCVIRVLPSISPETFPLKRLSPSRNNVRPHHETDDPQPPNSNLPPTPQYNNAILSDMYYVKHLHDLYKQTKLCSAFADACKLAK